MSWRKASCYISGATMPMKDGTFNALLYDAIAHFDHALGCWVGVIDWSPIPNMIDEPAAR